MDGCLKNEKTSSRVLSNNPWMDGCLKNEKAHLEF